MLGLGYPKEFWLRVTNSVLGTLLLLLLALVAIGLILDVLRRLKKRSVQNAKAAPRNAADVGTTLADGGEKLHRTDPSK